MNGAGSGAAGLAGLEPAALLAAANPWWFDPQWQAPACGQPRALEALAGLLHADAPPPLVVIDGPRQTGKSRLLDGLAAALLGAGLAASRLCRLPLEHGPLRWLEVEPLVEAWERRQAPASGGDRLLVDDLQLWPAAQQDGLAQLALAERRVVVVAGTALDGCVTRWRAAGLAVAHCRLAPLDFAAFLERDGAVPGLPAAPQLLRSLFDWPGPGFAALRPALERLQPAFEDYLERGGFAPAAFAGDRNEAAARLREEVVARSLRWDAAALHGVRNLAQLEATLSELACGAGQLLDMPALCARLTVERPTVRHFLDLLEQLGLLRRVAPLGYGARVQRARPLVLPADPALAAALLWQAGPAQAYQAQAALLRHLEGAYAARGGVVRFATAGRLGHALVVTAGTSALPFLLHWHDQPADPRALSAFSALCAREGAARGYLVTRASADFGPLGAGPSVVLMRVPAALLCLWLAAAAPAPLELKPPAAPRAR